MITRATRRPPTVADAIRAAKTIAQRLSKRLRPEPPWRQCRASFERFAPKEAQYGLIHVCEIPMPYEQRSVDFAVWVDRGGLPGREDDPMLCAAFGAEGRRAQQLEHVARTEGIEGREYGYQHRARAHGYRGEPVLDLPTNAARFVSCYRPIGDLR